MEPHYQGNQVTSPVLPHKSDSASTSREPSGRIRSIPAGGAITGKAAPLDTALLLDLSSNRAEARRWAERNLTEPEIWLIYKADLKWQSRLKALKHLRSIRHHTFAVFTQDAGAQSMRGAIMLFAALAGSAQIVWGDAAGTTLKRTRASVFLVEAPRLVFEIAFGYAAIVPLTWLITTLLGFSRALREVQRDRFHRKSKTPSRTLLYLRATLASATEGGMVTHSSGFASGARLLGHRIRFLISGKTSLSSTNQGASFIIEPSIAISATRALHEVWNNLTFTAKGLSLIGDGETDMEDFDLIYQRYSRFNLTGVALSLATGRPLLLEFNGSEVWVSQHWDPVGLVWLLKRIEKLNLDAADLIFVVSEVERRNLVATGVEPRRIIVNPNGVDTERFRPGCGGKDVRLSLGIDDRIVIGFLGTFGPWHGAPVLAEAAGHVSAEHACHYLFIGDGDERAITESILSSTGNSSRATFTGRVPHTDAPRYLDACDILVSPHVPSGDGSEFFGSPTKLFEYLAMERPVIASRLGQIADVIEDGENGLLVEPGDSRAIAAGIEMLTKDEPLRRRLGAAARQTVIEKYTWRHNAERVFDAAHNL
ncbi:MAG TPA: glycosyltransferase family 4 protein [Blastocatellia bacterium]|nr:glycosyltransferase family 4 protein [Blastocatellia bacterium]